MTEQEKMKQGYLWDDDGENSVYYFKNRRFDEQPLS